MRIAVFAAVLIAAICAMGCSKGNAPSSSSATTLTTDNGGAPSSAASQPATGSDVEAIRTAIEEHVRSDSGVNMNAMQMSVDSVNVNGDHARADAAFLPKQGGTGMAMTYFLERRTSGWVVTRSQPSGGQFTHPPMDGAHSATPANPSEPAMPDLTDFLRGHASDSKN